MREQIWLERNQKIGELSQMTAELLEETLALRETIRSQMEHPRWFAPSGREDFEAVLRDGFAFVCSVDGQVVASLQCLLRNGEYGVDLYSDPDIIRQCADYSDVFVHPDYRGNGLQNRMERRMEERCLSAGKKILLGTVDPDNVYSYRNFLKSNYRQAARLKKYGGLDRLLMEKKLL